MSFINRQTINGTLWGIAEKRLTVICLAFTLVIALVACSDVSNTEEELQAKFPEYFDLSTAKGLEVYVWQTAGDTYYCGVLPGTNRHKTDEEISNLETNGATVEEMKAILSYYDIPNEDITILPYKQAASDYDYQIDDSYLQNITALFEM